MFYLGTETLLHNTLYLERLIGIQGHGLQVFSDSLVSILYQSNSYVAVSFFFTQLYKTLAFTGVWPSALILRPCAGSFVFRAPLPVLVTVRLSDSHVNLTFPS